jgi:hypothetical protein
MKQVYLKGGKGCKARYNGKKVRLVGKRNGSWVTVAMIDGDDSATTTRSTLKWRSQAWNERDVQGGFLSIPDSVLANILAYLGWEDTLTAANSLFFSCKTLKQRVKPLIPLIPPLRVNLLHLDTVDQYQALLKVSNAHKFGIRVEELHVTVGSGNIELLHLLMAENFLPSADLKSLTIKTIRHCSGNYLFPYLLLESLSPDHPMTAFITERRSEWYSPAYGGLHELNDFLGDHCSKLSSLRTLFTFDSSNRSNNGAGRIFQLPSLRKLHLSLVGAGSEMMTALDKVVSEVPNLVHLKVGFSGVSRGRDWMYRGTLHSKSLRTLDFQDLGKFFFFRECVCPKLQHVICLRGSYGLEGLLTVDPIHFKHPFGDLDRNQSRFLVGEQPFFGLEAPADCVVEFINR